MQRNAIQFELSTNDDEVHVVCMLCVFSSFYLLFYSMCAHLNVVTTLLCRRAIVCPCRGGS